MTPADVIKFAKKNEAVLIDLRFIDFFGTWQHFELPAQDLSESFFTEGRMFDGSSIRGWQEIHESDMKIIPDPATAQMDPFSKYKTLVLICDVFDPITGEAYSRDPRNIARKAEKYLLSTGIGDTVFFGPEAEFFMFDDVRFDYSDAGGFFSLDSQEAPWTTGRAESPNLSYKIRHKEGYFPVRPWDISEDIRGEMVVEMQNVGLVVEASHHEVAPAQHEIDFRFDKLVKCADNLQWFKYIVRNVARRNNKVVTFMPKPMFGDNGSGMHVHQSIWKEGKPLFAGDKYAGMSEMAMYYIGGLLKHAPALAALINPLTNSYKRLVPGFEAPINLAYSNRNRSACIRIPVVDSPKARRLEFRCPDSGSNAYIAFAAMLMAGLDGIQNKIDPGQPFETNIYDLPPEELAKIPKMPGSLREALENLQKDHEFLLRGDVFTKDVIETWVNYKMENEVKKIDSRPHPFEFSLYFDI